MEKAIIVGVNTSIDNSSFNEEIEELKSLCFSCEIEVLDTVVQNLDRFNSSTYVGKGKLDEIKVCISDYDLDVVVFNDELNPSQISILEKELDITIYDRTFVILEIFKRRAKTKEAILQVELASLTYLLPRLAGMRKGLSRQRGSSGDGAHGKGAGETKLELDRRYFTARILSIKEELRALVSLRKQQRQKRLKENMITVALTGYTNSGKSTLLNSLLDISTNDKSKEVLEKDMLFATLETSTRLIKLPDFSLLITDTVGFVKKLPHQLVEAFKSTLEEITEATLIVHVVDASNPSFKTHIETTNNVLKEIGIKDIPMIYVFNKIDLVEGYFYIPPEYEKAIRISCKEKENLNGLIDFIKKEISYEYHSVVFSFPFEKADIITTLKEKGIVKEILQTEEGIKVTCSVPSYIKEKYKAFII